MHNALVWIVDVLALTLTKLNLTVDRLAEYRLQLEEFFDDLSREIAGSGAAFEISFQEMALQYCRDFLMRITT